MACRMVSERLTLIVQTNASSSDSSGTANSARSMVKSPLFSRSARFVEIPSSGAGRDSAGCFFSVTAWAASGGFSGGGSAPNAWPAITAKAINKTLRGRIAQASPNTDSLTPVLSLL